MSLGDGRARRAIGAVLALISCGVGCTGERSNGAPGDADPNRRVCPECAPSDVAGSETSDFSGSMDQCTGDPAPLPEGDALSSARDIMAAYAGPFESTLRWRYPANEWDPIPMLLEAPPSGYEEGTRISGNVVLGEPQFFTGRPAFADDMVECPDWFRVPASVEITTADGALAVTMEGAITMSPRWARSLRADANLADATGTLNLQFAAGSEHAGLLELELLVYPEGKRGNMILQLASGPSTFFALGATLPDDGCDWRGFPAAADEPLAALDGQSAAQFLDGWRSALKSALPMRGERADCSSSERRELDVDFELGAPEHVCQGKSLFDGSAPMITFENESRVTTSDESMGAALSIGVATPTLLSMRSIDPPARIAPEQFAAETGIIGVDPSSSPWLAYFSSIDFYRNEGTTTASGYIAVEGVDGDYAYRAAELRWPPDATAGFCPATQDLQLPPGK